MYKKYFLTICFILAFSVIPQQEVEAKSLYSSFSGFIKKGINKGKEVVKDNLVIADKVINETSSDNKETEQSESSEISLENIERNPLSNNIDFNLESSNGTSVEETNLDNDIKDVVVTYSDFQSSLSKFIGIFLSFGSFYLALSILRSIGLFMINIIQLSMIPNFPKARYFLLKNLSVSVICIMLLGSSGLLTKLITQAIFS